jgi:hypothetical protein
MTGASGTESTGTTDSEAAEAAPVPITFLAMTVKVYAVPLVNPVIVHEVLDVVQVNEPGDEVTV